MFLIDYLKKIIFPIFYFSSRTISLLCTGVQVLHGDLDEAICHHALYYSIWKKYGCLPERYNWKLDAPDVKFYPLRSARVFFKLFIFWIQIKKKILSPFSSCCSCIIHHVQLILKKRKKNIFFMSLQMVSKGTIKRTVRVNSRGKGTFFSFLWLSLN